jgi:hypothetical protein
MATKPPKIPTTPPPKGIPQPRPVKTPKGA